MTKSKRTKSRKPRVLVLGRSAGINVQRAGGEPVFMAATDKRAIEAAGHENVHAVLLLGGGDVDPSWYGEKATDDVYGVDGRRDLVELEVLDVARERGLPVLGICRGAQIMNVHSGGSLVVDLGSDDHWGTQHRATAEAGSKLARAWQRRDARVLSYHHQAVKNVGAGLQVAARADDGVVEAIESTDDWWRLGVQFHPEMAQASDELAQRIFDRFVYQAGLFAGVKVVPKSWSKPITVPAAKRTREPSIGVPATTRQRVHSPKTVEAARKGRQYTGTYGGPVNVSWRCFRGCRVDFDLEADYIDHMVLLHGEELEMRSADR